MKTRLLISFLFACQTVYPQSLNKIGQDYFRLDPFKMEFSQFLNNLINDPALVEKDIKKRTDTTLFYLSGIYPSHKPFFFPTTRCKIILAEQQGYTDSLSTIPYFYFVYQLVGYASQDDEGLKNVIQEFEKLNRRYKKGFDAINQKKLKRGGQESGAITNYSLKEMAFYPLTVAWATSADHKENIVAISIRFFMVDNKAFLPIPANSP